MKRQPLFTIALCMNLVAIVIFFARFTPGCNVNWSGDTTLTLGQKGLLVRLAAKNAVIQVHNETPGEWEDPVCSIATVVLKALDGDEESLDFLGLLGKGETTAIHVVLENPTQSTITLKTKDFLLDLLRLTATRYGLGEWEEMIEDGIAVFDAFLISGVSTEYETWFLTREFFAGVCEGCQMIGGE